MTDLEIARRCAEALKIPHVVWPHGVAYKWSVWPGKEPVYFNPLTDAEQNQRVEWELLNLGCTIHIDWVGLDKVRHCTVVYGGNSLRYPCRTIEEKRRAICLALCDVAGVGDG